MNNKILSFILKYDILIYIIIYTFSFGLILINSSVYWDGWSIYDTPLEDLHQQFVLNGNKIFGYIFQLIFLGDGVLIARVGTFACYFISGLILRTVLKEIKEIDSLNSFFIIALFMVFPINIARITIMNFTYCLTYLSFFIGLYILNRQFIKKSITLRIVSHIFFLFSFLTNSFLFFYAIALFLIAYHHNLKQDNLIKVVKSNLDFLISPILFFFIIRTLFFMPSGIFAMRNYNEISFINVILSPFNFGLILFEAIVMPLFYNTYSLFILLGASTIFILAKFNTKLIESNTNPKKFLFIALVICFIGAFPYLAVGRMPRFMGWGSRHQMLLPLGISLALTYFWNLFVKTKHIKFVILLVIILSSIAYNFSTYYDFIVDGLKQDSLIANIKENKTFKNEHYFEFIDYTKNYNAMNRDYRFFEYNGIFKKAFSNCKRLGSSSDIRYSDKFYNEMKKYNFYKFQDSDTKQNKIGIGIYHGRLPLNIKNVAYLQYLKLFDNNVYKEKIVDVIILTVL